MEYEQDVAMLTELNETLAEVKQADGSKDNSVYFKEQLQNFSTSAMPFEDITASIMEQTEDLFAVTRTCDRFSPEYLKLCKTLVNSVGHLGKCFLTKTALIQKKCDESKLAKLSAERLYEMLSCNFRKTETALNEKKEKLHEFDLELFNQLLTFSQVMGRLRSTQHRAWEINMWFKDPYEIMKSAHAFTEHDSNRAYTDKQCTPAPFRESPSYGLRWDVLEDVDARRQQAALPEGAAESAESVVEEHTVIAEDSAAEPSAPEMPGQAVSSEPEPQTDENQVSESTVSTDSLPVGVGGGDVSDKPRLITEMPSYQQVLEYARQRDGAQEGGVVHLTINDMCTMLCDENFRRNEPEVAKQFYQAVEQYIALHDSG